MELQLTILSSMEYKFPWQAKVHIYFWLFKTFPGDNFFSFGECAGPLFGPAAPFVKVLKGKNWETREVVFVPPAAELSSQFINKSLATLTNSSGQKLYNLSANFAFGLFTKFTLAFNLTPPKQFFIGPSAFLHSL